MLDSAIAPHLRADRTIPAKTPQNYEPPFPAYSARFPEKTKDIVMAISGAQAHAGMLGRDALHPILKLVNAKNGHAPRHWDMASVVDTEGCENRTMIAYWNTRTEYLDWSTSDGFDAWWEGLDPEVEPNGWFREVFFPPVERFETVSSDNSVPEGAAHMREGVSGAIREHVYWGSARDRLPIAQTEELSGDKYRPGATGNATSDADPQPKRRRRVRVPGKPNACVIRSGQDWSNTKPEERALYLDTMHPVLTKGMDFLRDDGTSVGCYSCRFMAVVDPSSPASDTDKTFGLAYFDDLESLEVWSREHKTHLDIFGRFLKYAQELNNDVSLRLFHEVLVLTPEQQALEYVGCHTGTGFLTASRS